MPSTRTYRLVSSLPWLLMAGMLAYPLVMALRATQVPWPLFWDACRDLGLANVIRAGHYPADACYPGEVNWYNPLMATLTALGGWISGAPLPAVNVALGPWLNLLGPVVFAVLIARLANTWVALAAVAFLLFGKPIDQPIWSTAAYSPWLLAPNTTQALFFLTLLLLFLALQRDRWPWHAATGLAWGVTFLGHTAPALAIGGIYLVLLAWTQVARWFGSGERASWLGFFLAASVAFVVSLPYTGPIFWKYQFHVVNEWPSVFADPYVELAQLPERLRGLLYPYNALVLLGFIVAARHARKHLAMRLLVAWALVAAAFLAQHYLWQWLRQRGVLVTGLVPGHHALVLAYGAKASLFGLGTGALAAWSMSRWDRAASLRGPRLPRRVYSVGFLLFIVVLFTMRHAPLLSVWPAYRQSRNPEHYEAVSADAMATYDWICANTDINDVFLAEYVEAVTLVQPTGRKLVATMLFYSNPYLDAMQRLTDTHAMHDALAANDEAAFRKLAAPYHVGYVLLQGDLHTKIEAAAPDFITPLWQHGAVAIYGVAPPTEKPAIGP